MANIPPAIGRFLAEMEYPATKDDLLREARRDGLSIDDQTLLRSLPEQNYNAGRHIRYHLTRQRRGKTLFASMPRVAIRT